MYLAYKNTNILYKILPCILIAIFLIMILSSSSFASSEMKIDNMTFIIPDEMSSYEYKLIFYTYGKQENGQYYFTKVFLYSDSPISIIDNPYASDMKYCISESNNFFGYSSNGSTWSDLSSINTIDLSVLDFKQSDRFTLKISGYNISFVYSSHDIKDSDGNVVFQAAPQEGELAPTIKSINFLEVVKEVLAILPIILLTVIGLLALRKAIRLILKMLHQM